jgi:hypothetical protein
MMKATACLTVAALVALCAGCLLSPQEPTHAAVPVTLTPSVVVTFYDLFDCGASQLNIRDKTGRQLYLFNKPFRRDLFLSTATCTDKPDMRYSVHITKGHPLQEALITSLETFLNGQCDQGKLDKIRKESDFTKLSAGERVLQGTIYFLDCLRDIKETANDVPEDTARKFADPQR